jgi:prepilin-type N-terminal cleavage/methylation domain-containing protein
MTARRQRGFTLIELMIALVVSTLLVGMILSIFSRISLAYRGQQQIAGVQQVLAAARATIEADAKQAGFAMPQGFKIANPGLPAPPVEWPVQIVDSATAPDQIAFFYADASAQAVVAPVGTWATLPQVTVDTTSTFVATDLVVLARVDTSTNSPINPGFDANVATYNSCVMQIATIAGLTVTFQTTGLWGKPGSAHCTAPSAGTLMYRFIAHGYRIDRSTTPATRPGMGALQQSPTGGLFGNNTSDGWVDIAYGFTDIQTALQVYDGDGIDTPDPDTDGNREWYSGAAQTPQTGTDGTTPVNAPLQMTISLVARTDRDVEGITTAATPALLDQVTPANTENNTVGNHPAATLAGTTDLWLQGSRIYRYITFSVDFRNIGVGR